MMSLERLDRQRADRGPRWHVGWTIRPGEHNGHYAATAEYAEKMADRERECGCYQIRVTPPVQYTDVAGEVQRLGDELRQIRQAEADVMGRAAALTVTANDGGSGIPETTLAASLGVDRMTIRKWLGKR